MFLGNFSSVEDIVKNYSGTRWYTGDSENNAQEDKIKNDLEGAEILIAWYGDGSYSGSSLVLYKKDGKLYEVHGAHCSCYGLEGQWSPEETTWEALSKRSWRITDTWYDLEKEAHEKVRELISENVGKNTAQTHSD